MGGVAVHSATLIRDLVLVILYHIICPGPEVEEGVPDDGEHVRRGLLLRGVGREPGAQQADRLPPEAGQPRVEHQ